MNVSLRGYIVQGSNRHLCNRRIDACTNIDSTVSQASIRLLYKCWLDGCTSVELTIVQVSNRRSQLSNRWLYWLFWKKSIKIFRCPFSATVEKEQTDIKLKLHEENFHQKDIKIVLLSSLRNSFGALISKLLI